jgi:predicted nucleic acid-binding protein
MNTERTLDASVAAAALFPEAQTAQARARLNALDGLLAPDLLFAEMASIAAKKVRRGLATQEDALEVLARVRDLVIETVPCRLHYERAFALAARHGFSAYDSLYLALAEARGAPVITADEKLVRRAAEAGLSALVEAL